MGVFENATQRQIDGTFFALIEDQLYDGQWRWCFRDKFTASEGHAAEIAYKAQLIEWEDFSDGRARLRLSAAGERLRDDREGMVAAVQESWATAEVTTSPIDTAEADDPPLDDGPIEGFMWRHRGEELEQQMRPAAWRLVAYLWDLTSKSAAFDDLAGPVFADSEEAVEGNNVGSWRRDANIFFRTHGIPWVVKTKSRVVMLVKK